MAHIFLQPVFSFPGEHLFFEGNADTVLPLRIKMGYIRDVIQAIDDVHRATAGSAPNASAAAASLTHRVLHRVLHFCLFAIYIICDVCCKLNFLNLVMF